MSIGIIRLHKFCKTKQEVGVSVSKLGTLVQTFQMGKVARSKGKGGRGGGGEHRHTNQAGTRQFVASICVTDMMDLHRAVKYCILVCSAWALLCRCGSTTEPCTIHTSCHDLLQEAHQVGRCVPGRTPP